MTPQRITLRRVRGWTMPPGCISVARPSRWGNPFHIEPGITAQHAVTAFQHWLLEPPDVTTIEPARRQWILDHLHELRGKSLACYCKPGKPCHADVLMGMATLL